MLDGAGRYALRSPQAPGLGPGQKGELAMPRVAPWHSIRISDKKVHHNNSACTEGNNIEKHYRKDGTDGRPLCERCAKLNAEGK